ncbi:GntP family permease [Mariniblastus fucicola]|uniref:Inner membrane permease YgbN n=1 Tax=Mariniblastus fucicola TaxID=980251 RepID=A0A5B9PB36_9BACT|nr:SLC13 family permease [Mariniblastus fucicola]QEG20331.1 Inner membrane permease YgbN [Mariniblastus fucicola]
MPLSTFLVALQDSSQSLSLTYLLTLLVLSVFVLLFLILKLRMQAFLALILASLFVAIGSSKELTNGAGTLELATIGGQIQSGMGSSLGFIATIIGLGAIFGSLLEHSGGAQSLAKSLLRIFGEKRASWAMVVTGFIISIPVFLDVALVIIAPILYALSRKTGKSVLAFGLPLLAGLMVTHAFVPPTPGPVWVAYEMGVGLGWVILFGCIVGFPTAIIGGILVPKRMAEKLYIAPPEEIADAEVAATENDASLPSLTSILVLIGLPILLILVGTIVKENVAKDIERAAIVESLEPEQQTNAKARKSAYESAVKTKISESNTITKTLLFLGHPIIALLLATLGALIYLGYGRGYDKSVLMDVTTKSLGPAGIIILITGAGGVFKGIMGASGVSEALSIACENWGIHVLVLAYLFAVFVRVAQGSATVAMVTAGGLMSGMAEGLSQPQLALVVVAIAAGASAVSHVNDSGFWMVSRYMLMTEKQTFQTWTVISTVVSVVGFLLALGLWYLIPLIGL